MLTLPDAWVAGAASSTAVVEKHTVLGNQIAVPVDALVPTLRRLSRIGKFDISNELDYLVVRDFDGLKEFLRLSTGKADIDFVRRRGAYALKRLGNVALARRLDLSASGTTGLAFLSSHRFVPGGVMWSLNLPE